MTAEMTAERQTMVESQVRTQDVTSTALIEAMRAVARERLLPAGKAFLAYADMEVEVAPGRWLLKPRDVAKLLQGLSPRPGERALAISAPYAAEVLARMGHAVTTIDAADAAPAGGFDLIVCEGAVAKTPPAWTEALAPGGRLGVVERDGAVGRAVLWLKTDATVGRRALFDCAPPYMAGFEPEKRFVF